MSIPLFSVAKDIQFDVNTLAQLGYSADVAAFYSEKARFSPGVNRITVNINGGSNQHVDGHFNHEGELCFDESLAEALHLNIAKRISSCDRIETAIPQARIEYYPGTFLVKMLVPESAIKASESNMQRGGSALMMNYNIFTQYTKNKLGTMQFSQGYLEPGFNWHNWIVRNSTNVSSGIGQNSIRVNETTATHAVEFLKSVIQLGQISNNATFYSGVPMNGVQLFSDDAQSGGSDLMVPLQGVAESNAVVEVAQRGRVIYRTLVAPGPFEITRVSQLSTGVPATLTVIEENGSRKTFVLNNMVVQSNSRQTTYSLGMGRYRTLSARDAEAPYLMTGEYAAALPLGQRAVFSGLLAKSYQGVASRLDYPGPGRSAMASGVAYSNGGGRSGGQLDTSLQTTLGGNFSVSVASLFRTIDYQMPEQAFNARDLAWDLKNQGIRQSHSASLSWSALDWGAVSLGATWSQYHDRRSDMYQTVSWVGKWHAATLNLSVSQSSTHSDQTIYAGISFPLWGGSVQNRMQKYNDTLALGSHFEKKWDENTRYTLDYSNSRQQQRLGAGVRATTPYASLGATVSQDSDQRQSATLLASGGMAWGMGVFATSPQPLADTFALVSIPDRAGIGMQSGRGTALTNYRGNALISSIDPYRASEVKINTQRLPLNVRLNSTTMDFKLARGSVGKQQLTATEYRQLLLSVTDEHGTALATGLSVVSEEGKLVNTVVGDGNIMLVNDEIHQPVWVKAASGKRCRVNFTVPEIFDAEALYEAAPAVCLPEA